MKIKNFFLIPGAFALFFTGCENGNTFLTETVDFTVLTSFSKLKTL